ncbi:c-type cytochrome [Yoonia sp. 208BN28-4]|uniref:c-type cytochrome n=1 Tax=Yoonia sp. 208BN28-4 TaxID=3126505 RepID=UPI0030B59ADE
MKFAPTGLMAITALALAGCTEEADDTRVDVFRGKALYQSQCAACHGPNGEGAGAASLGLGGPPPSLVTLSAQNGGVFPRDYVLGVIDGLERHNSPDAAMPEFGAGDMGPLILVEEDGLATPIPAEMLALATYLESIQQ